MAHVLILPRQGNTVESCIIVDWKVNEGDNVTEETAVCSVETDKAAFEVPAGVNGIVLKILRPAGDDVPVLDPIAVIGAAGENWEELISRDQGPGIRDQGNGGEVSPLAPKPPAFPLPPSAGDPPATPPSSSPHSPVSPRARNLAEKEALATEMVPGTGPGGRVIERDVQAALETRPPMTAAAKAAGPTAVPAAGSGIGGRITSADLTSPAPKLLGAENLGAGPLPAESSTEIKGIRKIIADRMHKSLAETAQFTLNSSAPVSRLQELRARMKTSENDSFAKITVNDLILFAVSRVLPRFSYMNAHKTGDTVTTFGLVHLGMAVDTPRGLMVPVIRNANLLSLAQISSEAKRLATACQNGSAKPDELSGSTFTVTNLGSLGITSFTPVLNIPEVAILGVCNIELKPAVPPVPDPRSLIPVYEPHIGFSLTINHQVVDGAPAARFLKALGEAIADIDLLLITG
ncbi:MAG: 2-oxo acid dehydrogenase subunit E2 [Treponema sp.]|nr:2-oxo acid dehydrogenase subunit E2 [Treponema sp.]